MTCLCLKPWLEVRQSSSPVVTARIVIEAWAMCRGTCVNITMDGVLVEGLTLSASHNKVQFIWISTPSSNLQSDFCSIDEVGSLERCLGWVDLEQMSGGRCGIVSSGLGKRCWALRQAAVSLGDFLFPFHPLTATCYHPRIRPPNHQQHHPPPPPITQPLGSSAWLLWRLAVNIRSEFLPYGREAVCVSERNQWDIPLVKKSDLPS